ncbi:uncharacterized protein PHACADRAFT_213014 [Phanerochaete carnosa HHB-10118-sp]|uniref:DUF6533 domain-containing protein n=1 Tax=Phanerochaete carnosa (strain HHB-10118-sp) TaxID=650164 RepID=K5WLE2_PHACS|nr:uncharacterized protein PHACADRAFT_213014 [Phanerochaete carnosa HHB-10118-sp]EKM51112.1 hypothetical protein PHACADRAFT_213014 [Phanerochaete carnosa HHB-10118-sp]
MAGPLDASQLGTLRHNRLSNYFDVISCTLIIYDFMLTFNGELTLIWPSSWSTIKILFLLTRYATLRSSTSRLSSGFVYESTGWLLLTVILMLRTWAVYERRRAVAIGLVIWTIVTWVPNMTSLGIFLKSLRYGPLPVQHVPGSGCHVVSGSPIVFICWVLLMVFEAAILGLMAYKAVKNYRADKDSAIFKTVFRDGTVFYLYLFILSTANVIVILTASADLINLLSLPERMLHSILTARIILSLREFGSRSQLGWSTFSAGVRGPAGGVGGELEFARDAEDNFADADPSAIADETNTAVRNSDSETAHV